MRTRDFSKNLHQTILSIAAWFVLLIFLAPLAAQEIFPNLSGQILLDSLVARYKPSYTLSYSTARDRMYALIDNHEDSVHCVYSDYTIYVPYNSPTPRNYTNAATPIINCEHTWPKSLGATGLAESDLHHLFPTNEIPNAARGNLPFDEIPDSQADRWYRKTQVLTSIPTQHIAEYSKLDENRAFEPREDHRGDVARAMFYFYTMYRAKADSAGPGFFDQQKTVLRRWNMTDPVDSAEIARTNLIATFQDDKPNPFILDTTLIGRAYFGVPASIIPEMGSMLPNDFSMNPAFPNPFNSRTIVSFVLPHPGVVDVQVFDTGGRQWLHHQTRTLPGGNNSVVIQADNWASGFYFVRMKFAGRYAIRKILLLR